MGGGASHGSLEGLLQSTLMVGRAIASIYRNPGMYRLQDFHSSLAPRLKSNKAQNPFVFFGREPDEEEDLGPDPEPILYEHLFHVVVNEETIYFDDVCSENEAAWTPLHTCCMSFHTAQAGCAIIDEMQRRGASLNTKTRAGPGTFNKGWTALHMACAYNVEPLVEKLISSGADCNTMNCFGYSPLLEACHRGYLPVVQCLVNGGADLTHVPPDSMSNQSPFAAAPAHSALGEAARCGFTKIVTLLLESGAKVNATNSLGWTPLHEAVFYNRRDVAAALLDAGADATLRTRSGALPYHLSGLEEVRALLASHGGPRAIPGDGDTVNMLDILHEITVGAAHQSDGGGEQPVFTLQLVEGDDDDYGEEEEDGDDEVFRLMQLMSGDMGLGYDPDDKDVFGDDYDDRLLDTTHQVKPSHSDVDAGDKGTPRREARGPAIDRDIRQYDADDKTSEPALLHSGAMLGNLPALRGTASPEAAVQRSERDLHEALRYGDGSKTKKKGKKTNKKPKATTAPDIPADIPTKFLCQLSQRPMQEPVQSIYGHIYEHYTILQWFQQQGQICPLTGAPLSATDLKAMPELAEQIMQWVLQRGSAQASAPEPANVPVPTGPTNPSTSNDDLYDF